MPADYRIIELHVPGRSYVPRFVSMLRYVHAAYNCFAWQPGITLVDPVLENYPIWHTNEPMYYHITDKSASVHAFARFAEEEFNAIEIAHMLMLPDYEALELVDVQQAQSFKFSLSGLGRLVDSLAEIFDPLRRRERRQRLEAEMRRSEAETGKIILENELSSVHIMTAKIKVLKQLEKEEAIDKDEARLAMRGLVSAQDRAMAVLEYEHVEVVDVRDDDRREIA